MSTGAIPVPTDLEDDLPGERPRSLLRGLLSSWEGRVGIAAGLLCLAIIVIGPLVAPYAPNELSVGPPTAGPSGAHPLGTDNFGRDVLSRFLYGGASVLLVPLGAIVLAYLVGGTVGMLGAYSGGRLDAVITRAFDLLLTLPPLLIVLVVIGGAGFSSWVLLVVVAMVFLPRAGRVVRGAAQGIVTSDFVAASQARGESTASILFRDVAPNIAGPVAADFALRVTYAIIFVATLNFLGLGAQPPSPNWGLSVATSRPFLSVQPLATLAPAFGIAVLSVSFNLIADGLTRQLTRDRGEAAQL